MKNWILVICSILLFSCGSKEIKNTEPQEDNTVIEETVSNEDNVEKKEQYFIGSWIEQQDAKEVLLEVTINSNGTMFQSEGTTASSGTWEQMSSNHLRVSLDGQESQNWFVSFNEDSTININVQKVKSKSALSRRFSRLNQ